MVEGDPDQQRRSGEHHRRVAGIPGGNLLAQQPQQKGQYRRAQGRQGQRHAHDAARLGRLAGTDPVGNAGAAGNGQRQGHHVEQSGQVGGDLVAGRRHDAQPGNEERHQCQGSHFHHVRQAGRQTHPEKAGNLPPVGLLQPGPDLVGPVDGIAAQQQHGHQQQEVVDQQGCPGAADSALRR